jgi:hypothetical protein
MALKRIRQPAAAQAAKTVSAALPLAPLPSASDRDASRCDLLTPAMAADRLKVSTKVLERWRGVRTDLTYIKLGAKTIRYRNEDLDAFIAGRSRTSTAGS